MISVRIDIFPHGDHHRPIHRGTVEIINDLTGTEDTGNYDVILRDERGRVLRCGRVEGFARQSEPHWVLVAKAMAALADEKSPS